MGTYIRNQHWTENEQALTITLHQPFWSAWQRYGWEEPVEGFGIALEAVERAEKEKKKIRVLMIHYGMYEVSTKTIRKYENNLFTGTRDKKPLIVIPRTACKKVTK